MRQRRRPFRLAAVLGMLGIVALTAVAGCGDDDGPAPLASPSGTASTSATAPASPEASPSASVSPSPSPTDAAPSSVSQQELAGEAEQAAVATATATTTAADMMSAAAADGAVDEQEVEQVRGAIAAAGQQIDSAGSLLSYYRDLFPVFADATQAELEQLTTHLADVGDELRNVATLVEDAQTEGQVLVDTFNDTAVRAGTSAEQLTEQASAWAVATTAAVKSQIAQAREAVATDIASDEAGALAAAAAFRQKAGAAIRSDGGLTQQVLNDVYSAAANAIAGLQEQGGELAKAAAKVKKITELLAAGQVPEAGKSLAALHRSLT